METKPQTISVPLPPLPQWDFQQPSNSTGLSVPPAPPDLAYLPQVTRQQEIAQALAILQAYQMAPMQQQAIAPIASQQRDRLPLMFLGVLGSMTMVACTAVIAQSLPNASVSATQQAQLEMMREVAKRPGTNVCIAFSCPAPAPVVAPPSAGEFVPVVGQPVQNVNY